MSALSAAGADDARAAQGASPPPRPSFARTVTSVLAINTIAWAYNRYLQQFEWARVSPATWWANVRSGFTWDDDAFGVNQLAHPYHGSLYHNAARANGYSFWGAVPFVLLGSASWEILAEGVPPSLNDLINTTMGGLALGEATSRLSRRAGSGAILLDPIGNIQRWLGAGRATGESDRASPRMSASLSVGTHLPLADVSRGPPLGILELEMQHGTSGRESVRRPFDVFRVGLELMRDTTWKVARLRVDGMLAGSRPRRLAGGLATFGVVQVYEFVTVPLVVGTQSIGGMIGYRAALGSGAEIGVALQADPVLLAEVAADFHGARRRDYDYALGLGLGVSGTIGRAGREWIRVEGRRLWAEALYGSHGRHAVSFLRVVGTLPAAGAIGVGGDLRLTARRSSYPDQTVVNKRYPEMRVYLRWLAS